MKIVERVFKYGCGAEDTYFTDLDCLDSTNSYSNDLTISISNKMDAVEHAYESMGYRSPRYVKDLTTLIEDYYNF